MTKLSDKWCELKIIRLHSEETSVTISDISRADYKSGNCYKIKDNVYTIYNCSNWFWLTSRILRNLLMLVCEKSVIFIITYQSVFHKFNLTYDCIFFWFSERFIMKDTFWTINMHIMYHQRHICMYVPAKCTHRPISIYVYLQLHYSCLHVCVSPACNMNCICNSIYRCFRSDTLY